MANDKAKRIEANITKSKEVIREAFKDFDTKDMAITWTGGKDSTLTLWLIREVCREDKIEIPEVMTIDEFDVFPEIHEFMEKYAKEWGLDLEWCRNDDVIKAAGGKLNNTVKVSDLDERNQAELKRINFNEGTFPFEAESYTGNHLMKTVEFNKYIERHNVKAIFQGLRRDEQAARINDDYREKKEAGHLIPEHIRIKPILHFTERDVWDTTLHNKIPYCTLYEQGYRSLGAKTTSAIAEPGIPAWEQDLENTTERAGRRQDKEQQMSRLRDLGYM